MIRWMYGYTQLDEIRKEVTKEKVIVTSYKIK